VSAVERVLEHVEGIQKRSNGFWALCPAHDDHDPSLHIQEADNGNALLICRTGCIQAEVIASLERRGFNRRDLFADTSAGARRTPHKGPHKGQDRLVKRHNVKDDSGVLRGIHERWESPTGKKSFLWRLPNGKYSRGGETDPATMPLYGAELIGSWPKGCQVVLCEGETPAEALRERGIRAVGTVCGAGLTPSREVLEVLRDHEVVAWPDNDSRGLTHMRRCVAELEDICGAPLRWFEWEGAPHKGDGADHPAIDGGDIEAVRELERQLWSARVLEPGEARAALEAEPGGDDEDDSNDSNDNKFQEFQDLADLADLPDAEKFPVAALPPTPRQFVREAAASVGCPVDYIGLSVLAALSAAIGDTRRIELKKDWTEGAAIFGMIVGGPASKKTPAMNLALRPIRKRQMDLKAEYERQKEEYESALRDFEKSKKGGPSEVRKPDKPTLGRTYADDTTVERLADILNENRRGVLITKDELSGWLGAMNQYKQGGKGADRQFWLSVHTNQPVTVDRKSSDEPVIVAHPWVSVIGGIQPEVLPDFGKDRGDGLIDRFIPVYPNPRVGRWTDDEISDHVREEYASTINRLYRLRHANDDEDPFPRTVDMTDEAKALFRSEYDRMHEELESPGFPQRLRPAWGKLEAYLARLALIIAMARIAELGNKGDVGIDETVTRDDMVGAIKLLSYFKNHVRRVYTGLYGDSPSDRLAADLRDFLIAEGGAWEGIASELHKALASDYKPERPEDLAKAIRGIAKRSALLELEDLKRTQDRRPFRLTLRNAVIAVIAVSAVSPSSEADKEIEVVL
jgi:hypothetical protein